MNLFSIFKKESDLIYRPDEIQYQHIEVERISLTAKEAVRIGFSFRWKSKSVRITNYHGTAETLIIPSMIGGKKVNEISAKAFFRNQTVKKLQIPSGIKKMGKSAFQESRLESCLFADGLAYIPESAFEYCTFLSEVHLPWNVAEIRKNAFCGCKALTYIEFPMCCYGYADGAFENSGLAGFGYEKNYYPVKNGLAFQNTPLQHNYALILEDNYDNCMNILMIGYKIRTVGNAFTITADNVSFGLNVFEKIPVSLDMTRCKNISFFDPFVRMRKYKYDYSSQIFPDITLRFPKYYQKRVHLPFFVKGYIGNSNEAPLPYIESHITGKTNRMTVYEGSFLCSNDMGTCNVFAPDTLNHFAEKIILESRTGFLYRIEERTFDLTFLKELTLNLVFYAEGVIFSEYCELLHKVTWTENNQRIIKYIPCAELIGNFLHTKLLKAFVSCGNHFFDSRVILDVFQSQKFAFCTWNKQWEYRSGAHTRQRVFIAIDTLRSTQRDFDINTDSYLHYLKTHIRKARTYCEKIKDKYPEYLEYLEFLNTLTPEE